MNQALLIFDPLVTLWGQFQTPYFKMLTDARVASACSYVRTRRRVRNSQKIATGGGGGGGKCTNYRTVPGTGWFNVSGVMILFLQLYRRYNPNKLKTQSVLHLNGCFVAIYVKKSSQNPMINVLRMSYYYQKRVTYEVA